jgi:segregation and condensation protein A
MDYIVKLESFEGPMDLLLELIKKRQMDIFDLKMSQITKDYMEQLTNMNEINIEVTSNFLVIASLLIDIKTKMLIPKEKEKEDPREKLVQLLLDHQSYKQSIENLIELKELDKKSLRSFRRPTLKTKKISTIFELAKAYESLLNTKFDPKNFNTMAEELTRLVYTIEEQITYLKETITDEIEFAELFSRFTSRDEAIVSFSALLELIKIKEIDVFIRDGLFIFARKGGDEHVETSY